MDNNTMSKVGTGAIVAFIVAACAATDKADTSDTMSMTFGNSSNVQVVDNPTMMFHDIVVSKTPGGAELEGKMHVKRRAKYIPGHINIAVVNKKTGDTVSVISTDFNHRIARHGHRNLRHANNFGSRLPNIDPDAVTIHVAYHHSNVDRYSQRDCGANVAMAAINK